MKVRMKSEHKPNKNYKIHQFTKHVLLKKENTKTTRSQKPAGRCTAVYQRFLLSSASHSTINFHYPLKTSPDHSYTINSSHHFNNITTAAAAAATPPFTDLVASNLYQLAAHRRQLHCTSKRSGIRQYLDHWHVELCRLRRRNIYMA